MKRHTTQNKKQKRGQYFTTNAATLLDGYEHVVKGKFVTEPFAGGGDLTRWCLENGATEVQQFDIEPQNEETMLNDSIMNPVFHGVIVSNPPYLSRNKNKDKTAYDHWQHSDLYKCHLGAIVSTNIESGILILPSNFLSESSSYARNFFFSTYRMNHVKYYRTRVFDDATTGIVVFDFEKWNLQPTMTCTYEIFYDNESFKTEFTARDKDGWLVGSEFFDRIEQASAEFKIKILREGEESNSNIIIGLLDKGKYALGAHYNEGDPLYCAPKAFTTYQCVLNKEYPVEIQKRAVEIFNELMSEYREKYHSMFLSNYMGATQKILSRTYAERLLAESFREALEEQGIYE